MRIKTSKRIAFAAAALLAPLFVSGVLAKEKKPQQPFYRKYLVPGDPLDERILELERSVAANPDSAALRNDFGNVLAARKFPEQALEQYEKGLELDREHFLAAYNMGLVFETQGEISRAIGAYRKSIARKPGFPHSRFRLGRLYEKRGWERLAVAEYARALRLDPAMRDPRRNPLVVDTRLLDRASLANYSRDLATASLPEGLAYADPGSAPRPAAPPIDRPLFSEEVQDPSAPEPLDSPEGARARESPRTSIVPPSVGAAAAPGALPPQPPPVPVEGELLPATGAERPPYIGGPLRPTPLATPFAP